MNCVCVCGGSLPNFNFSLLLPGGGRPADDEGSSPPPPDGHDLSPLEGGLAPKARSHGRRCGGETARDQVVRVRGGTAKMGARRRRGWRRHVRGLHPGEPKGAGAEDRQVRRCRPSPSPAGFSDPRPLMIHDAFAPREICLQVIERPTTKVAELSSEFMSRMNATGIALFSIVGT